VFESINCRAGLRQDASWPPASTGSTACLPSRFVAAGRPVRPERLDPSCVYDAQTRTFCQVADDLRVDPVTGALTGRALLDIAFTKDALRN